MATTPLVFFGMQNSAAIWETSQGYLDGPTSDGAIPPVYTGGTAYKAQATSVLLAPNGRREESIFVRLFFIVTYSMASTIRLTPIIDGIAYDGTGGTSDLRVTLNLLAQAKRVTKRYVVDLMVPYIVGGIERTRTAARGVWFQSKVETIGNLAPGDLIWEVSLLEHEQAESTLVASN